MTQTAIAHIAQREEGYALQSLQEHAENTANLAKAIAKTWGEKWENTAELLGLLHDAGKFQPDFQQHILVASGYDTSRKDVKAFHALAGAAWAQEHSHNNELLQSILTHCIAGHHRGLYNDETLLEKIDSCETNKKLSDSKRGSKKEKTNWLHERLQAIVNPQSSPYEIDLLSRQMLIRMLFSTLVDADFLDTEAFMQPERKALRQQLSHSKEGLWDRLRSLLQQHTDRFKADTEVNKARASFLEQCRRHGAMAEKGVYSLSLPTGAGKTLSSMAWALETARKHDASRIIYIIPYTSIITQTAAQFRKIFGEEYVLEHHSDINFTERKDGKFNPDKEAEEERRYNAHKLLSENWDSPIIVTTSVQFLESLFANKPSRCRKVHNIANAVLVFDEAQKLPLPFLNPTLAAIDSLSLSFGTQTLFCTATLPIFDCDLPQELFLPTGDEFDSLYNEVEDIIPYEDSTFQHFSRVNYHLRPIEENMEDFAQRLLSHDSLLCIVNTRNSASALFNTIIQQGGKEEEWFHLSRNMCSAHIQDTLQVIKQRLSEGKNTKVISTPLVEAGVDVDLPVVYRSQSGLDSIIQAAGRCNREGKLAQKGEVFIFNLKGERAVQGEMRQAKETTSIYLKKLDYQIDPENPKVIKEYYTRFFSVQKTFDEHHIIDALMMFRDYYSLDAADIVLDFETVAENFHLIDDKNQKEVLVPYTENLSVLLKEYERKHFVTKDFFRKLQRQTVSITSKHFDTLKRSGRIEEIFLFGEEHSPIYLLTDALSYDSKRGLILENHFLEDTLLA